MSTAPLKIVACEIGGQCAICRQHLAAYVLETSVTMKTFGFSGTHEIKVPFCTVCKKQLQDGLAAADTPGAPVVPSA